MAAHARRVLGFFAALAVLSACPVAHAQNLSAVQVFTLADTLRAQNRIAGAAALYDALTQDADPEVRIEARFRKAVMLAAAGRLAEAAVELRRIVDERPDAVRVRLELAQVLAALGRLNEAERELRQAMTGGLPPQVALSVERMAQGLRAQRPVAGSFQIGLAPDTNVNRATQARTLETVIAPLTLSQDARATSGVGLDLEAGGVARHALNDRWSVWARLSGNSTLYRDDQFNDAGLAAQVGAERRSAAGRQGLSYSQSWRWFGGERLVETRGVSADWARPLGPAAQLQLRGAISSADYRLNDLQDGEIYQLRAGYDRALDVRTSFSLGLTLGRQSARDKGYAMKSAGVSALVWREFMRSTAFVSMDVQHSQADARLLLFPERRRDWLVSTSLGLTLRRLSIAGFAPTARLTAEKNSSTVGLYDYRRLSSNFGLVRAF